MDDFLLMELEARRELHRSRPRSPWQRRLDLEAEGFRCAHCRVYVSANPLLAGVNNRNHCPYCLWSRHLDLHTAGDRLAACREKMKPVGLALKRSAKKYGSSSQGELMLVHECQECGKVSVNRIAADDLADTLYEVFRVSIASGVQSRLAGAGVEVLGRYEEPLVVERLIWR